MTDRTKVQKVIDRLEPMPKQGESYDHMGRHGFRNPIRKDTGPLLQVYTHKQKPKHILEIGTAHGLSLCHIGIQANGASMVTIEWDEATAREAQGNLNEAGLNATVLCGDAMKILDTLVQPFDLVFMDANKDGYLEQFKLLETRKLLSPGCLVLADNVIDRQTECQNFLDYMQKYSPKVENTECGLLVAAI